MQLNKKTYKKRIAAVMMTTVMLMTIFGGSVMTALAAPSKIAAFPDISDSELRRDTAVLQLLGVVSGDENGNFNPNGTLTRAQFCKMAVMAMGKGDQVGLYNNRTIFPDVRSSHWARGYINYAVSGEKKLIIGNSDGTFKPEDPVTGAQAVTILLRMLGYTDADAGMLWPDGYLSLGRDTGLTSGVTIAQANAPLSRADAARIFVNLLDTDKKGGGAFAATVGTTTDNVVVMELDVNTPDGTPGGIRTSSGILKPANGVLPAYVLGMRGTLITNTAGKLLTIVPDANRQVTITAGTVGAAWIKDTTGVKYNIASDVPAYTATKKSTYGAAFVDIASGMNVSLYFGADGIVNGVYVNTSKSIAALVFNSDTASSLGSLTSGDTGYKIIKNGALASYGDIRQYDVLTYDKSARILYVSDFRLTGYYENCWPNMENPSKVSVLGHEFSVLPSAADSLAAIKVGQIATFLFTNDLQVAGAASNALVGSTAVGIVQTGATASSATVKLLNGLTISGKLNISDYSATKLSGELVSVTSSEAGQISLTRIFAMTASGVFDLKNQTLDGKPLSPAVKIFERVGKGAVTQITLNDLNQATIPTSKVLYSNTDSAGRVDMIILDDVTGDRYTYGFLKKQVSGEGSSSVIEQNTVSVINADNQSGTSYAHTSITYDEGILGGIVISIDGESATGFVKLIAAPNISRTAFYTANDKMFVKIEGIEYPIADNVQCYNNMGKSWFKTIDEARAFSDKMTVYYDRAPSDGGKIRVVSVG